MQRSCRALVFAKHNYILLIVGVLLICIGLFLMIGGGSDDPNVFNDEIFLKMCTIQIQIIF